MKPMMFKQGKDIWPAGLKLLHVYALVDLQRNPDFARLVSAQRAAIRDFPVALVEDRWLHITLAQITGQDGTTLPPQQRERLVTELTRQLRDVNPCTILAGSCESYGSGTIYDLSATEPLVEISHRIRATVEFVFGPEAGAYDPGVLHLTHSYATAEADSDQVQRKLRHVTPGHAPLYIDAVHLLNVQADNEHKTITWEEPLARIPLGTTPQSAAYEAIPPQRETCPSSIAESVTIPKGAAPNEDRILTADNGVVAVIDGATDKSGRDYGGALAAHCVSDTLAALSPRATPRDAVAQITEDLARLRKRWNIPADDPAAPTAAAAVHVPHLGVIWRVGDIHVALRHGTEWTCHPAVKRIDDVLAGTRAAYLHCLLAAGHDLQQLAADDPGRRVILPVLEQQGRLANRPGPFGYGVLDGTSVPDAYIETIAVEGADEIVLASDGYLSAAPTLAEAETALATTIAEDPLRIGLRPGTKAVKPGANSYDDRTYVRIRLHPDRPGNRVVASLSAPPAP